MKVVEHLKLGKKSIEIEDEDDDDVGDGEKGNSSGKTKRQYSDVWPHFTIIKKKAKDGKIEERAQCNHCKNDYAYHSHKNGTNSYMRHLEACKLKKKNGDVGAMLINAEGKLQARKIDHMVFS